MAKMKHDSATVKMSLQVPRGLLEFLAILQKLNGEEPKAYLEGLLAKELEMILGSSVAADIFDVELVRIMYGQGSHIPGSDQRAVKQSHPLFREVKVNE
jgi:hypothetical protein